MKAFDKIEKNATLMKNLFRKPNKHVVGFFEKNGLQHGEFPLRTIGNNVIINRQFCAHR
jgi:hypothetical protein